MAAGEQCVLVAPGKDFLASRHVSHQDYCETGRVFAAHTSPSATQATSTQASAPSFSASDAMCESTSRIGKIEHTATTPSVENSEFLHVLNFGASLAYCPAGNISAGEKTESQVSESQGMQGGEANHPGRDSASAFVNPRIPESRGVPLLTPQEAFCDSRSMIQNLVAAARETKSLSPESGRKRKEQDHMPCAIESLKRSDVGKVRRPRPARRPAT